jgi:hypothetical protein
MTLQAVKECVSLRRYAKNIEEQGFLGPEDLFANGQRALDMRRICRVEACIGKPKPLGLHDISRNFGDCDNGRRRVGACPFEVAGDRSLWR